MITIPLFQINYFDWKCIGFQNIVNILKEVVIVSNSNRSGNSLMITKYSKRRKPEWHYGQKT